MVNLIQKTIAKFFTLFGLSIVDYYLTCYILKNGFGEEANPVLNFFMTEGDDPVIIIGLKLIALLFMLLTVSVCFRNNYLHKLDRALTWLCWVQFFVVFYSFALVMRSL